MFLTLMLVTLLLTLGNGQQGTGFRARITQRALDYANDQALAALRAMVPKAVIQDTGGKGHDYSYTLSKIRLTGFSLPGGSMKLVPQKGIAMSASNIAVGVHADFRVKYKKGKFIRFSVSGSVDVDVSATSFSVNLILGQDAEGRPSISSSGCACTVGHVSVHIHKKIKYIANLFKDEIQRRIKSMIPDKLCSVLQTEISTNAEAELKKMRVLTSLLGKKFLLDYRLVAPPSFQAAYMETYHKGLITWAADPKPPPFTPKPLPVSTSSSNMLYLWIDDFVPQSFLYAAQNHGFLTYNLTSKDLPPDQQGFLNTTCSGIKCLGLLVPAIGFKYPHSKVDLLMNSTAVPGVVIAPNQLQANFTGDIALYARTPTGQTAYLFTLNVSSVFNMTVAIANQKVVGNITYSSFKVDVKKYPKPTVWPIFGSVITTIMEFAMKYFIVPQLNAEGIIGFPLPVTSDISFVNTQLQLQQNALMIGTDIVYKPSSADHDNSLKHLSSDAASVARMNDPRQDPMTFNVVA